MYSILRLAVGGVCSGTQEAVNSFLLPLNDGVLANGCTAEKNVMNRGYVFFVLVLAAAALAASFLFSVLSPGEDDSSQIFLLTLPASPEPLLNSAVFDSNETAEPSLQSVVPLTGEDNLLFLPVLFYAPEAEAAVSDPAVRRINVPYFNGEVRYAETAVVWFGKVTSTENFADIRIGYNAQHLYINLAIYDRHLWYNPQPSPESFHLEDSVSIYLSPQGGPLSAAGTDLYRFDSMLSWWEERSGFQAAYKSSGGSWTLANIPFTTRTGWRGNAPNNNSGDDRGWNATFVIPFSSLGLQEAPPQGSFWSIGVAVHDKDEPNAAPIAKKYWPDAFDPAIIESWGELRYGIPIFTAPALPEAGQARIRHKENGAYVPGAAVGGGTDCGDGLSFWTQWGNTPSPGSESNSVFNVQNQQDVADWPCFSRYYLTFPLDSIPGDKIILSATLTIHQMGSSGGGDWGAPSPSYIQVFTVREDWSETALTWNNAPLARENVSGAWVSAVESQPEWPGIPWEWDLSAALAEAYRSGEPLRLALYSADEQYHSGKYFVSSYTGDWNYRARPALTVSWANR
jgi:hypothetical protein